MQDFFRTFSLGVFAKDSTEQTVFSTLFATTHPRRQRMIDQDRLFPDNLDLFPTDYDIFFVAEQSKQFGSTEHHDGYQLCRTRIHFHVVHAPKPHPVTNVDNLFIVHIRNSAKHNSRLPFLYSYEEIFSKRPISRFLIVRAKTEPYSLAKGCVRVYNKVEICGVNTATLKVLTEAEKKQLLRRVKEGDKQAREELVNGNLRLVLSVIQRFTGRGENLDDLFQIGCIGLIKSIDNFDISQNVRFSTYAVPMIIGEIRRYLRDNNAIRISRSVRDTAYKAMQIKEQLTNLHMREPTVEEIAAQMEVPQEEIVLALESIVDPVSLYEPVYSDGGDTIYVMDQIGDSNDDRNWLEELALKEAMRSLGDREKKILHLRFFKGLTQMEVSAEIGISQAQVSRLEKGALERIKKQL